MSALCWRVRPFIPLSNNDACFGSLLTRDSVIRGALFTIKIGYYPNARDILGFPCCRSIDRS